MTEQEFVDIELSSGEIADAIIKYEGMGFLTSSNYKKTQAIGFELLTIWLLNTTKEYDKTLEITLYPVLLKVLKRYDSEVDITTIKFIILMLFNEFPVDLFKATVSDFHTSPRIDIEAEFLNSFSENFHLPSI